MAAKELSDELTIMVCCDNRTKLADQEAMSPIIVSSKCGSVRVLGRWYCNRYRVPGAQSCLSFFFLTSPLIYPNHVLLTENYLQEVLWLCRCCSPRILVEIRQSLSISWFHFLQKILKDQVWVTREKTYASRTMTKKKGQGLTHALERDLDNVLF